MRTFGQHLPQMWRIICLAFMASPAFLPSAFSAPSLLISTGAVWRYFDAGMDPGPGWMAPGFDDSVWRIGQAELGFGDGDEVTILNRPLNTAYFRGTFTVANPAEVTALNLDLYRDDGAIVYLNGIEVLRNNMPPGPVGYFTLASSAALDDGEIPVQANLSPSLLLAGLNTIAVEVHQNSATSTDMSFDLLLLADAAQPNRAPTADNQSVIVTQNTATPIALTGSDPDGNPLTFIITLAPSHGTLSGTAPSVTYTPTLDYSGPDSFRFKVNDGTLDSAEATVSIQVVPPPDPPEIVSAVAECGGTEVVVTFNEPVDPAGATDVLNYLIQDAVGNFAIVISATLSGQQAVTLGLAAPLNPASLYTLLATAICDLAGDCLPLQSVPVQFNSEPPVVVCDTAVENLWPPNHSLVDVGLSAVSSEPAIQVQVFSNEPDSGNGDAQLVNGVLFVRAQREGKLDGRVYLIVVTSTDACGNIAVCCTTVVAPHDSSQGALNAVTAEAAAAEAGCSPTGSPITPFEILP